MYKTKGQLRKMDQNSQRERKSADTRRIDMRHSLVVLSTVLMLAAVFFFFFFAAAASQPELRSRLPTTGKQTTPTLLELYMNAVHGAEGGGGGGGAAEKRRQRRTWPCCDRCGGCTNSIPSQCQCQDLVLSCHPSCRSCVPSPLAVEPSMYQCMDRIPNYCRRRCHPNPLLLGQQ